ncbi:flagellar protein FlgJ [Altererythrobacter atlanticus]|uniref:Flagellar rod assembly protein/muramidase FlgJ n=1 Tax=Croceibacterium atlanticum TaxID=1267766 RepID=A0A0F7KY54_9SPHN|nr:rod-binding protein [Croceibacterium atlanticum]AKH44176.1 flagellar rod assembly protein/muramidase FlgJ [Croceibacterium atlanticum]MBB5732487.1 flagellar protein FlgJ [Croceibacterium atlanticum]
MTQPIALASHNASSAFQSTQPGDREKLGEVAEQFEAIFLRQMLAAARKADFGGNELFGGQGEQTFREMQDAQFADIASQTGMIGFAASIEAQLSQYIQPED